MDTAIDDGNKTSTTHKISKNKILQEQMIYLNDGGFQNEDDRTFEDIIRILGNSGKFQFIQCALCLTPLMLLTFMALGFVFIGYTPPHVCNKVNETEILLNNGLYNYNESSAKIDYGKCDITVSTNQSGRMKKVLSMDCPNGHHFPGGKHMTLVSEWDLVCEKTGLAETAQLMYTLGNVVGGLIIPTLADRYGRKPVMCISTLFSTIIEFGIAFAPNMYVVCSALLIDGIAYGGAGCVLIVLGMEILIARHRQIYGVMVCLYWVFCVVVVGLVGYLTEHIGWRYFQAIGALTGLLGVLMVPFMYESPRWLAINGRGKEALAILKKASQQNGSNYSAVKKAFLNYMNHILANEKNGEPEMSEQEACTKAVDDTGSLENVDEIKTNANKHTLVSMLRRKDTLILLLVLWYLWTTCNLTFYGIYMSSSDLVGNRFLNFCLMGIVEIPANILVLYMMNRMGRVHVVRIYISLASLSLLSSMLLIVFDDKSHQSMIASAVLFIFGKFAITCFFNAIFIFTPEIFPTVLRSAGNGSCKSVPRIGTMLATYSRPLYVVARWAPGLVFTVMCVVGFFLTFLLPETKDKILPTKLNDVNLKRKRRFTFNMRPNKHAMA